MVAPQEILKQGSFRNEKTQDAAKYNFRLWHCIQEALLQGPFALRGRGWKTDIRLMERP